MENPTKMDDDWGYPYFRKPPFHFFHLAYILNVLIVIGCYTFFNGATGLSRKLAVENMFETALSGSAVEWRVSAPFTTRSGIFGRHCIWACAWSSATSINEDRLQSPTRKASILTVFESYLSYPINDINGSWVQWFNSVHVLPLPLRLNLRPWAHYGDKVGNLTEDEEKTKKTS